MQTFTVHSAATAPAGSQALIAKSQKTWGFVPTLHGILAQSPVTYQAYDTLYDLVGQSNLTAIEQQVVYQTANVYHGCEYCTAGHTYLSRAAGMPEAVLQALREGHTLPDAKLQALHAFTYAVIDRRGMVPAMVVNDFIKAGYTQANVLEVITVIATKTISNYTNHIANTPKESFMADPSLAWFAPEKRLKAA